MFPAAVDCHHDCPCLAQLASLHANAALAGKVYIILFQDVIATFFGCFRVGGVLVTAFTLSSYMILSNHEDFQTPEHSLFKIVTMLAGEFNYQEFFYKPLPPEGFGSDWDQWYESPPFPLITYILFSVFFFAGPMITMNVFVGLIVDASSRHFVEIADLHMMSMRLNFILEAERKTWITYPLRNFSFESKFEIEKHRK